MRLNPEKEYVKAIRESIKQNDGYCTCIVKKSDDTKCPCKDFRVDNVCHCGLYVDD